MRRMKSNMDRSSTLGLGLTKVIKQEQVDDSIFLQEITPEWQFQSVPFPTTFHTFPAEQATEGFINRYPRRGECQSLNTFLVHYFPENEGAIGEVKMTTPQKTSRACLVLRCTRKLEVAAEQVDERPLETQPRDDTYRIKYMTEEPRNYPFKHRGSSYLLPPQGIVEKSPVRYGPSKTPLKRPTPISNDTNSRAELATGTDLKRMLTSTPALTSPEPIIASSPDIKEDAEHFHSRWPKSDIPRWNELLELIGPLPSVDVDPNGFSSQSEFRPFLEKGLEEY